MRFGELGTEYKSSLSTGIIGILVCKYILRGSELGILALDANSMRAIRNRIIKGEPLA
jgi:hypothetical protein